MHCEECAAPIDLFDDGKFHHCPDDLDALAAAERDHAAAPCWYCEVAGVEPVLVAAGRVLRAVERDRADWPTPPTDPTGIDAHEWWEGIDE